jgi:hypothetical protein
MAFGNFLGGAAKGMESVAKVSLLDRVSSMKERQLLQNQARLLIGQADKRIGDTLKLFNTTLTSAKEAGHSPEQIAAATEYLLADIADLSTQIGRDPTPIITSLKTQIEAPLPVDEKNKLEIGKLEREASAARAQLEDSAISADAGLRALDAVAAIPGADVFLTNPGLITATRQALSLGKRDPTGLLAGVPSELSGIPQDKLETALNAAETVAKQRNALGQAISNQAGVAGLRARLTALGEGAGLEVQRGVFSQALENR